MTAVIVVSEMVLFVATVSFLVLNNRIKKGRGVAIRQSMASRVASLDMRRQALIRVTVPMMVASLATTVTMSAVA